MGKTYFISSEEFYTWKHVSKKTAEVLNRRLLSIKVPHWIVMSAAGISEFFGRFMEKPPVLNFEKGRDIVQNFWICSVDKAKADFGYRQTVSLEEGIKRTTDWYKQHGWL
jgi:nucleoside-diphosphate-sugar epimerase